MTLAESVQNTISTFTSEQTRDSLFLEVFTAQFGSRLNALLVDTESPEGDFGLWLRGFRSELLEVVDREVMREIDEICRNNPAGEARQTALIQSFNACLDISFEMFWGVFESIVRAQPTNPIDFVSRNDDIALAFIDTVKARTDSENLHQRIQECCARRPTKKPCVNFFRKAAVPVPYELFRKFGDLCSDPSVVFDVYKPIMAEFTALCETMSHGKQNGYPTFGSRDGWNKLLAALEVQHDGKIHVITTQHEYMPMIDLKNTDVTVVESGDVGKISDNIKTALSACGDGDKPVVLISSVRRTGERIDVDSIMREIKNAYPNAICVIDAAQDYAMHDPDVVDVVSYSKRIGGSGAGVLLISKALDDKLGRPFEVKSGISVKDLAIAVASLRCALQKNISQIALATY